MRFKITAIIFGFLIIGYPFLASAAIKVPILVYHSISEYDGFMEKELYVTPENFEKQMTYLKDNGFTLLTFERWNEIAQVQKPIFITFDDGYKNNVNVYQIFRKIKTEQFQPAGTFFVISDFIGRPNRLTSSDLKKLSKLGMISIQSHTATHPELTKMNNYPYELGESKRKIERITGKAVLALAYPYGLYNDEVIAETKKYYQYGLTTDPGPYKKLNLKNELYRLPRTYIYYSTTLENFEKIVNAN